MEVKGKVVNTLDQMLDQVPVLLDDRSHMTTWTTAIRQLLGMTRHQAGETDEVVDEVMAEDKVGREDEDEDVAMEEAGTAIETRNEDQVVNMACPQIPMLVNNPIRTPRSRNSNSNLLTININNRTSSPNTNNNSNSIHTSPIPSLSIHTTQINRINHQPITTSRQCHFPSTLNINPKCPSSNSCHLPVDLLSTQISAGSSLQAVTRARTTYPIRQTTGIQAIVISETHHKYLYVAYL
jgi:hypothetical protein